jgi:hypothetical protein
MLATELYQDEHLKYPENGTLGLVSSPPSNLAPYLDPVPQDPGNTPSACLPEGYRWWGNTGQAQKYCLWACLEEGGVFAASPKGTRRLSATPSDIDCW